MMRTVATKRKKGLTVLGPKDGFRFACHGGLDCYTRCCRDITIVLTPYDIIRMKKALHLTSEDFLAAYTVALMGDAGLPVVVLKMQANDEKTCPFVTSRGCRIYSDRPWACRIYPLQPESTKITEKAGKTYYSVMDVPFCRGLASDQIQSLSDWIEHQGIPVYQEMEALFKKITTSDQLAQEKITNQKIREMYYMACYDLDRFRRFVLESTFLDRFDVAPEEIEQMNADDVALYRFAVRWLEYGLLGQHALRVRPDVLAAQKQAMGIA